MKSIVSKKIIKLMIIWSIIFVAIFLFVLPLTDKEVNNKDLSYLDSNFDIKNYQITLNVDDDNKVDVEEKITINYDQDGYKGFYKYIPIWMEYNTKDGKKFTRKIDITNVRVIGEKFILEEVDNNKRLRIGSTHTSYEKGEHTYTIKYRYNMGKDPNKDFDELIFHMFDNYGNSNINNMDIYVNMPYTIDKTKVKFFKDKERKELVNNQINYEVKDNVLYANFKNGFSINNALTLDIELEEGYFLRGTNNYGKISFIICILVIIISIISFIKWLLYGKNNEKEIETVEFYPPEGFDAATIGYIYGERNIKKLTTSLIIQLASKGYISLLKNNNKTYTVTNLFPKHGIYSDLKNNSTRVIRILENNTKKIIVSNFDEFYTKNNELIESGQIKIESDKLEIITDEIREEINNQRGNIKIKEKILTITEQTVYNKLFENNDINNISEDNDFPSVFTKVEKYLKTIIEKRVYDIESKKVMKKTFITLVISIILTIIAVFVNDMNPIYNILYKITFISIFIAGISTIFMSRKTVYGEKILAKIKGFRNYLDIAEKEQIEAQVEKNPNYFYEILPYVYTLNISKKWMSNFENTNIQNIDINTISSDDDIFIIE